MKMNILVAGKRDADYLNFTRLAIKNCAHIAVVVAVVGPVAIHSKPTAQLPLLMDYL